MKNNLNTVIFLICDQTKYSDKAVITFTYLLA